MSVRASNWPVIQTSIESWISRCSKVRKEQVQFANGKRGHGADSQATWTILSLRPVGNQDVDVIETVDSDPLTYHEIIHGPAEMVIRITLETISQDFTKNAWLLAARFLAASNSEITKPLLKTAGLYLQQIGPEIRGADIFFDNRMHCRVEFDATLDLELCFDMAAEGMYLETDELPSVIDRAYLSSFIEDEAGDLLPASLQLDDHLIDPET